MAELEELGDKSKQFEIREKIALWEARKILIRPKPWYMTITTDESSPVWLDIRAQLNKDETISNKFLTVPEEATEFVSDLIKFTDSFISDADTMADASFSAEDLDIEMDVSNLLVCMVDKVADDLSGEKSNDDSKEKPVYKDVCSVYKDSVQNNADTIKAELVKLLIDMVSAVAQTFQNEASEGSGDGNLSTNEEFFIAYPIGILVKSASLPDGKIEKFKKMYKRKSTLTEFDELLRYLIPFQKFVPQENLINKSYPKIFSNSKHKKPQRLSLPDMDKIDDPTYIICREGVFPTSKDLESAVTIP